MSSELVCGVDVGTTMVKAALFDLEDPALPLAVEEAPSPTRAPHPGWSETRPADARGALVEGIRRVLHGVDSSRVHALGISATACGAWLVDRNGEPVRDAILWNDGRASARVERWATDGTTDRIFEISGNVPFPGYTLPLLGWLHEHEPETLARADLVLYPKDWLRAELTGVLGSDETDASYVPFDVRRRAWSSELAELTGAAAAERLLPELLPADHVAPLLPEVAAELGLRAGLPVGTGLTDIISGMLGAGAVAPGQAVSALGTSAVSTVVTDRPVFDPHGVGIMAAAPFGRWARTMVNPFGSSTLDWMADLLCDGSVPELLRYAESCESGADGVVLLPHLSPVGVVSPYVEPAARGVIAGLRGHHGRGELARAAVEGLACAVAECYGALPVDVADIVAVGGAARSDLLLQTIADTTGSPVSRPEGDAFGARSVALQAARAGGLISTNHDLETMLRSVRIARTFEPAGDAAAGQALERYRAAAASTRGMWAGWKAGQ